MMGTSDLSHIKDFDIVHCQINYLEKFCVEWLDKINCKIVLTTGQWHLPQIHKSALSEKILNHKNVVLWVSQNPIYDNSDRYLAFPYGICHTNIKIYSEVLISKSETDIPTISKKKLSYLPINNCTNDCRKKLPVQPSISAVEYYKAITEANFILSPIGDRDDCYRHYEAIGLGCVPVSNVSSFYKTFLRPI